MRQLSFPQKKKSRTRIDTIMTTLRDYYLLSDVARMLRCMPHQIVYLLATRKVPEPARLGNRRLFRQEDVRRIASRLGIDLQREEVGADAG
jgi:MerR-like DNA binding protein